MTARPSAAVEQAAATFRLLSDGTRLRILYALLEGGELAVADLAIVTGVMTSSVSHALRLLRLGGVVVARREGRSVRYRLADDRVRALLETVRGHDDN